MYQNMLILYNFQKYFFMLNFEPMLTSSEPPSLNTVGSQVNNILSGNSHLEKSNNIECVVCCDKSSGKHYGQFTCEGKILFQYQLKTF